MIISDKEEIANLFLNKLYKTFNFDKADEVSYSTEHKLLVDQYILNKEFINNDSTSDHYSKISIKEIIEAIKKNEYKV